MNQIKLDSRKLKREAKELTLNYIKQNKKEFRKFSQEQKQTLKNNLKENFLLVLERGALLEEVWKLSNLEMVYSTEHIKYWTNKVGLEMTGGTNWPTLAIETQLTRNVAFYTLTPEIYKIAHQIVDENKSLETLEIEADLLVDEYFEDCFKLYPMIKKENDTYYMENFGRIINMDKVSEQMLSVETLNVLEKDGIKTFVLGKYTFIKELNSFISANTVIVPINVFEQFNKQYLVIEELKEKIKKEQEEKRKQALEKEMEQAINEGDKVNE